MPSKKTTLTLLLALAALPLPARAETQCALATANAPASVDDTALLQRTIDQCADQGGGVLKLDARTYHIGPIQLRSHVYLWLRAGTVLEATTDPQRYRAAFIGWPYRANEALISGDRITDSGLLGCGRIDGQGDAWWNDARRQRRDGTMRRRFPDVPDANGLPRPWLVEFYDSHDIRIDGPTLQNSPMWTLALRNSRDVTIRNLTIRNPKDAANTDGIDIVASQRVRIERADISTGDDNITIKSGLAGFDMPAQASSEVSIKDVKLGDGHGLSIGSETLNGVDHIRVDGVSFDGTSNGIRIKTGRDRGADIGFIDVAHVRMHNVDTALSVTAYYPNVPVERGDAQSISATTPRIHDVRIDDLTADASASAGRLIGLPESPLQNVTLNDVRIEAVHGLTLRDATVDTRNLRITTREGDTLIQQEGAIVTAR